MATQRPQQVPLWQNVLLFCVCLPCIPIGCSIIGVELVNKKRKKEAAIPKPLPRRRRALSASRGEPSIKNMGLFGQLPYEIRYMIYMYTLGNNVLHLVHNSQKRSIETYHCDGPEPLEHLHSSGLSLGELALLRTCRQIYIEAAQVLYTENVFGIFGAANLATFVYFSKTIRPSRLASITSLHIKCQANQFRPIPNDYRPALRSLSKHVFRAPEHQRMWTLLWGVIASKMCGLSDLEVCVVRSRIWELKLDLEEEWVKPMLEVRGLKTFKFDLHGREDEYTDEYSNRLKWLQRHLEWTLCIRSG